MTEAVLLPVELKKSYNSHKECVDDLKFQGCKDLGWLNGGITVPKDFKGRYVYSTRRGTGEVCCDLIRREFYSVDMGD